MRFYCDGGKNFLAWFVGLACGWWLGCWSVGMAELGMDLIWIVAKFYLCSFFLWVWLNWHWREKKKNQGFFQVSARRVLLGGCSGFGLVVSGWEIEKNRETENKDEERRKWDFFNTFSHNSPKFLSPLSHYFSSLSSFSLSHLLSPLFRPKHHPPSKSNITHQWSNLNKTT